LILIVIDIWLKELIVGKLTHKYGNTPICSGNKISKLARIYEEQQQINSSSKSK